MFTFLIIIMYHTFIGITIIRVHLNKLTQKLILVLTVGGGGGYFNHISSRSYAATDTIPNSV